MKIILKFLVSIALTATAHTATAAIVYDGGSPDQASGYYADSDYVYSSTATKNNIISNISFNSMTWWGADDANSNTSGTFTFSIYDGSGATPGALIATTTIGNLIDNLTGNSIIGGSYQEHIYTGNFATISLTAGNYFFELSNNDADPSGTWFWETTSNGLSGGVSFLNGSGYQFTGVNLAFNLSNNVLTVPEPEAWASLMGGLTMMATITRRRRQK